MTTTSEDPGGTSSSYEAPGVLASPGWSGYSLVRQHYEHHQHHHWASSSSYYAHNSHHSPSLPMPMPMPPCEEGRVEIRYINLAKRPRRRAGIEGRLRSAGLAASSKRFEATTGDEAPEAIVTRYWNSRLNAAFDKTTLPHPKVPLTDGERGCATSHARLWAACAARPDEGKPLVVLEDDVEFVPQFDAFLERAIRVVEDAVPPGDRALLLYLGADVAAWSPPRDSQAAKLRLRQEAMTLFDDPPEATPRSVRLLSADYLWQTSSYVAWPRAARALVDQLPIAEPVDNYISRQILSGHVFALVAVPFLVRQLNAYNDGDILHSRPLLACHDLNADDVAPAPILNHHHRW